MYKKDVLIIGTGGIGKRHIRGFLKTDRIKLSVVETNAERLKDVLDTYDIEEGFTDLTKTDPGKYDLAVICTPANTHIPIGRQCADAGTHFLLEKPLAVTLDGVESLLKTVEQKKLVVRIGYVRRSGKEHIEMREQVMNGRIGDLRMSYINISQEFPKYRPDYREIYYARADMGGGAILDFASHLIDILQWFFGKPKEVCSMYDHLQLEGVEVEDCCLISIRFQNGGMAQININQFQKPNSSSIEMIGTKGNLLLESANLKFADDDSGNWQEENFAEGLKPMEVHENRFRFQADMMLDAIEGRPDHLTTLREAKNNLQVALAAKESYQTKRIIELNL